jgi:hypothetical protein
MHVAMFYHMAVTNVLEKNSLGGHGQCVEMHVHMQMDHVGKEKQMF